MQENKFRIQDDLYEFVNHDELAKKEIPLDRPTVGGFADLAIAVEKTLMQDFEDLSKNINTVNDTHFKNALLIYQKMLNNTLKPEAAKVGFDKYIDSFSKINNISLFNLNFKYLYNNLFPLPFQFSVDVNMKDTKYHALCLMGPGLILPDTEYYNEQNPTKQALLDAYSKMCQAVLSVFFKDHQYIDDLIKKTLAFDAIIATLVKSRLEWSDYTKNFNPHSFEEVSKLLAPVDFEKIVNQIYGAQPKQIIVYDPRFLQGFTKLFNEKNYELYHAWSLVSFIMGNAKYLCDELRIASTVFDRLLTGTKEPSTLKKYAYKLVADGLYSEVVGIYYGKKYFGEAAKKDVINIVHGLVKSYQDRLEKNNWLSAQTKQKAILKLDKMKIKIGWPDNLAKVFQFIKFDINQNLFEIVKSIYLSKRDYENSLLYKDVDTSVWYMPGHLVNACYNPTSNDITFPAAILQKPFYALSQTAAQNFGGIGTVIGHEISHAFDNNGAKCDEDGNLNNWWTPEDYSKFEEKTNQMINQFDGLPFANGAVNGKLVVSENIADLGGVAAALQTMERENKTNYSEFFINYAKSWAQKASEEYKQLLLAIDVHAPTYWRANMQPRNFSQWYSTFNVTANDKMYLDVSQRIEIW
ncbi:MAG: M13 family metallopeptidase [Malacoplasma sp.]|nr:M13 family metallopeptidase [Malacoplasma sp.]